MTTVNGQKQVECFLKSLIKNQDVITRYIDYWNGIKPTAGDMETYYRMFLFAFMSVHTSWRINVKGYQMLDMLLTSCGGFMPGIESDQPDDYLWQELINCKAGLQKRRHLGIVRFSSKFRENPDWFWPKKNESIHLCRDRLMPELYGLGMAKTSFALEMAFPDTQDVVCLDTHMIKFYDVRDKAGHPVKGSINDRVYRDIEKHWCDTCKAVGVPSSIARHIWWDQKQGQANTDYWSFVFRKNNT